LLIQQPFRVMGAALRSGCDVHDQILVCLLVEDSLSSCQWLQTVASVSCGSRQAVVNAVCVCVDRGPTASMVTALGFIAVDDDSRASQSLLRTVKDTRPSVRAASIKALTQFAVGAEVTAALVELLADSTEDVVNAAIEACCSLASPSDEVILALGRLEGSWTTRKLAIGAICDVAESGDRTAMAVLQRGLADSSQWVRMASVDAMAKIAWRGDRVPLTWIVRRLQDEAWCVRVSAVSAVAQLAERGDVDVLLSLAPQIEDSYASVRIATLEAIVEVARRGDREAIALVTSRFQDLDPDVRVAAIESLVHLSENGNEDALGALALRMRDDEDQDVREAAQSAMGQL